MVEYAFPLMAFVGLSANATFGSRCGIMSTASPDLPYSCISRPSLGSRLLGVKSNVTVVVICIIHWLNVLGVRLDVLC